MFYHPLKCFIVENLFYLSVKIVISNQIGLCNDLAHEFFHNFFSFFLIKVKLLLIRLSMASRLSSSRLYWQFYLWLLGYFLSFNSFSNHLEHAILHFFTDSSLLCFQICLQSRSNFSQIAILTELYQIFKCLLVHIE